jgi:hypothetical protein
VGRDARGRIESGESEERSQSGETSNCMGMSNKEREREMRYITLLLSGIHHVHAFVEEEVLYPKSVLI